MAFWDVRYVPGFVAKSGRVGRSRKRWARSKRLPTPKESKRFIAALDKCLAVNQALPVPYEAGHEVVTIRIWNENQRVPTTLYANARPEQKFAIKVDPDPRPSRGDEMRYHFGG